MIKEYQVYYSLLNTLNKFNVDRKFITKSIYFMTDNGIRKRIKFIETLLIHQGIDTNQLKRELLLSKLID